MFVLRINNIVFGSGEKTEWLVSYNPNNDIAISSVNEYCQVERGYLADIDRQAEELFLRLAKQMADAEGITEKLKASDQMEWVGRMNSIRNRAMEIVNAELIFA